MAHRLDTYVIHGEISNLCKNSVTGRLHVLRSTILNGRSVNRPAILLLSLTGNLAGQLAGKRLRFQPRSQQSNPTPTPAPLPDLFHAEQIGILTDSLLHTIQVPLADDDNTPLSNHTPHPANNQFRSSIYLEWSSQNGAVAIELLDPQIELDDPTLTPAIPREESDSPQTPASLLNPPVSSLLTSEETTFEVVPDSPNFTQDTDPDEDNTDNPWQLFSPNLEDQIRQSIASPNRRSWEELIPGIDPETRRLYETWDEVLGGEKDEPLTLLFDEPLHLPKPHSIRDEKHAWQALSQLLKAMALRGVAFDMCPHFSAQDAYKLLIDDLLPEAGVHPALVDTGFICHFSTAEFCQHCETELREIA